MWMIWRSPAVGLLVEVAEDAAKERLERLLTRDVTPQSIGGRLTTRLSEDPRDWAAIDALTTLATDQDITLPEKVAAALDEAHTEDRTLIMTVRKCWSCAFNPAKCDLSGIVLCNVGVSLSPIGDVTSIVRESGHYMFGQEVDDIDLFLSAIGLSAVALTAPTGGSALVIKAGAGLAKTAYKVGALSEPVLRLARQIAKTGVDWPMVARARPATFSADLARAIRPEIVAPAMAFLASAHEIKAATNIKDSLYLISKADDITDMRRISVAAKVLGPRTTGTMELIGKSRIFRAITRWSDEVYAVIASAVTLIVAIFGLILSAGKSLTLRWLRRTARPEGSRAD